MTVSDQESKWDHLTELVSQVMDRREVPGVAVGILYQGETTTAGFGVTSVDNPLPATDSTLFQIGSITKTFTGTAVLRLVEMGKMDVLRKADGTIGWLRMGRLHVRQGG